MAFPVPDHLPRKQPTADVSSKILATISDTTSKQLTSQLAAEWVSELQLNIQQTKDRIYDRIHDELPSFERQLESSKSVQTRLRDLSVNVDKLAGALENPETGLVPTLFASLKAHKELAQRASDAQVTYEALSYLGECRAQFESLTVLVKDGHLADAARQAKELAALLDGAPEALTRAEVMTDMKNQLRILKDRVEEQLSETFSRSVRISSTELHISQSVRVHQSQTIITLRDILSSLSAASLNSILASLRRDIVAYFIVYPLQQASSSNISRAPDVDGTPSICFSIFPLPPSPTFPNSTPAYLKLLFDFLRENLFPALPPSATTSFPQSFYQPTATALLCNVLGPSLPSSLSNLPPFLELAQDSVRFEQEFFSVKDSRIDGVQSEGDIQAWARGIASHYGRKRRIDLLAAARKVILSTTDDRLERVEVSQSPEGSVPVQAPEVIPVQGDIDGVDQPENGWDFDDDARNGPNNKQPPGHMGEEADSWDFGDPDTSATSQTKVEDVVQDDSDAWGWGDEEESGLAPAATENGNSEKSTQQPTNGHQADQPRQEEKSEDSSWDSAWDEPEPVPPILPSPVLPLPPAKAPKVAKRLEKLSAKGKGKGNISPALSSNPPSSTFSLSSTFPSSISSISPTVSSPRSQSLSAATSPVRHVERPSSNLQTAPLKPPALSLPQKKTKEPETYLISGRVQDLVDLVSDILSEGRAIASSLIFSDFSLSSPDSTHNASTLVLQAAPAALDLYRAVYPVAFTMELSRPARALRFANDCAYVHDEVTKMELPTDGATTVHDQMREAMERLHALGAWWFDEGIERECVRILQILSRAEGFLDTGDQDRFDDCEAVMSEVLRDVRTATAEWKTILPRTKWLRAAGRVVETALARVLTDVLAIPDIPEVDSGRLSELCRILSAFEGLFVDADNPDAPSMVLDYVPSWLKYSYLSELLEASIADISYLFDEGALIDFSVDELVRLVRALFADTPLRANTIAKLQRGHPVPVE